MKQNEAQRTASPFLPASSKTKYDSGKEGSEYERSDYFTKDMLVGKEQRLDLKGNGKEKEESNSIS